MNKPKAVVGILLMSISILLALTVVLSESQEDLKARIMDELISLNYNIHELELSDGTVVVSYYRYVDKSVPTDEVIGIIDSIVSKKPNWPDKVTIIPENKKGAIVKINVNIMDYLSYVKGDITKGQLVHRFKIEPIQKPTKEQTPIVRSPLFQTLILFIFAVGLMSLLASLKHHQAEVVIGNKVYHPFHHNTYSHNSQLKYISGFKKN